MIKNSYQAWTITSGSDTVIANPAAQVGGHLKTYGTWDILIELIWAEEEPSGLLLAPSWWF